LQRTLNRRGCETPHCSFLISFVSAIHEPPRLGTDILGDTVIPNNIPEFVFF
jgi:hypothetical protein